MLSDSQFNHAYDKYSKLALYNIYKVVRNEAIAEEILQDSFIRFLEKADPERHEEHKAFLLHICHNMAVDYLKKNMRVKNLDPHYDEVDQRTTINESESRILRLQLLEKLAHTGPHYLDIFLMRVEYKMTYEEISRVMKIPKRTMMRYVNNLKVLVKDFL